MTRLEQRVVGVLQNHGGAEQAITYSALADALGVKARTLRATVRRLTLVYHLPICSSYEAKEGGYYWARTAEEIRLSAEKLEQHAVSILSRSADLLNLSLPSYLGQLKFRFSSEKAKDWG